MMSDPDKASIETERLCSVFQQAPMTLAVTVVNAVLSVIVLEPVVSQRLRFIWLALIIAVACARWFVRQAFLRRPPENDRNRLFARLSVLGSAAMGVLWGVGVTAVPFTDQVYQLFVAFVIGGMCAGAITVNSAHLPTVLAFILPASLPLAAYLLVQGSVPGIVSGMMVLIFSTALSFTAFRAHRAFGERLELTFALGRQGRELHEAYTRLREEVAERKRSEKILQQAQKMEAIGQMTGGIAHDFNNLLQVVSSSLSRIRNLAKDNAQIIGPVENAERAVARGGQLTGSLLAFARRQTLQSEQVDLNALLQEFRPLLFQATDRKARLQMTLAPDLPLCYADPAQFQSAVLNLVLNARDALPPEGGQISIATELTTLAKEDLLANPDANPGQFISISVHDNGSGMTEEVQARAFEPFYTTKQLGKGSGLGLSQVYGFAHQSGGLIQLYSKPGSGTRVTLFLPVAGT